MRLIHEKLVLRLQNRVSVNPLAPKQRCFGVRICYTVNLILKLAVLDIILKLRGGGGGGGGGGGRYLLRWEWEPKQKHLGTNAVSKHNRSLLSVIIQRLLDVIYLHIHWIHLWCSLNTLQLSQRWTAEVQQHYHHAWLHIFSWNKPHRDVAILEAVPLWSYVTISGAPFTNMV